MKLLRKYHMAKSSSGFSLVEVTLAIGITAVALVSLMGMLPKGMATLRKAADQAIMGRIHQQILGELQLTPWEPKGSGQSPLESFDGMVRFYDDQGIQLADSEKGKMSHIYTARISVPKKGSSRLPKSVGGGIYRGVGVVASGSEEASTSDEFVRLVVVEVTSNVDPSFLANPRLEFDRLDYPNAIRTYRSIVAKFGQLDN
ncbi:MAG: Verru_Chthon cassette protein B [Verrucomicrobiales bacterium]|nr:Verru_Chthon cassette protein B [Verrucomicrobiales bacterium]